MIRKEKVAANGMNWTSNMSQESTIMDEAKRWLGLVPVNRTHVTKYINDKEVDDIKTMNGDNFKSAREKAAQDFFTKELNLNDINITDSKLSYTKNNGILWVRIGNDARLSALNTIAKLSKKHKMDVRLLPKIPKEFWERSRSLELNCFNERKQHPELRTQIRLGYKDLELMTKNSSEAFWQPNP